MGDEKRASNRVPELLLEREALGELSPQMQAGLSQRLAALSEEERSQLEARREELRRGNAEILAAYPPEVMARKIERRAQAAASAKARPAWSLLLPVGGALAVCALGIVMLRSGTPYLPGAEEHGGASGADSALESTRVKGLRPLLLIFAKPEPGQPPRSLADGALVHTHELLQLGYVAASKPHGVVLSIDGRGTATLHYPAAPRHSTQLRSGQVLLQSSYELDDAPRFERFFLITATTPIDVDTVLAAAQRLAADAQHAPSAQLALPAGFEQTSLLLMKEEDRDKKKDVTGTPP
jgi:hypothetical protein